MAEAEHAMSEMLTKIARSVKAHPYRYAGGVAALLVGYWIVRRRRAAAFGGFGALGATPASLAAAAGKQVAAATARVGLADYRKAEDQQLFWGAPKDDTGAYLKGAYWLAVAARCSTEWSLNTMASAYYSAGRNRAYASTVGRMFPMITKPLNFVLPNATASQTGILVAAANAIRAAAPSNPGAKAAAAALFSLSDAGKIETAKGVAKSRTGLEIAKGTVKGSIEDVQDYAEKVGDYAGAASNAIRMLFGINPPGGQPPYPAWKTWAIRIGVGAVVVGGLRLYFGKEYHAVKSAVGGMVDQAKALHGAVTAPRGEA